MNRFVKILLAIALMVAISGVSKSFAITSGTNQLHVSASVEPVSSSIEAKKCCEETHKKNSLKTAACLHLCILSVPYDASASLMLSDLLFPPMRTEGRGLARAKLKRPPRTLL